MQLDPNKRPTATQALQTLKVATATRRGKLATIWRAMKAKDDEGRYRSLLERMNLEKPSGLKARLEQRLVIHALNLTDTPDTGNHTA